MVWKCLEIATVELLNFIFRGSTMGKSGYTCVRYIFCYLNITLWVSHPQQVYSHSSKSVTNTNWVIILNGPLLLYLVNIMQLIIKFKAGTSPFFLNIRIWNHIYENSLIWWSTIGYNLKTFICLILLYY